MQLYTQCQDVVHSPGVTTTHDAVLTHNPPVTLPPQAEADALADKVTALVQTYCKL